MTSVKWPATACAISRRSNGSRWRAGNFFERVDMFQADRQDPDLEITRRFPEPASHLDDIQLRLEGNLPGGNYA